MKGALAEPPGEVAVTHGCTSAGLSRAAELFLISRMLSAASFPRSLFTHCSLKSGSGFPSTEGARWGNCKTGVFSKCVRGLLLSIDIATKPWQPVSRSVDKIWMHICVARLEQRGLFTTNEYIDKILLRTHQGQVRDRVSCQPWCYGRLMEKVCGKWLSLLWHRTYAERMLNLPRV